MCRWAGLLVLAINFVIPAEVEIQVETIGENGYFLEVELPGFKEAHSIHHIVLAAVIYNECLLGREYHPHLLRTTWRQRFLRHFFDLHPERIQV